MRRSFVVLSFAVSIIVSTIAMPGAAIAQASLPPVSPVETTGSNPAEIHAFVIAVGPRDPLTIAWFEIDPRQPQRLVLHPVDPSAVQQPETTVEVYTGDPQGDRRRTVVNVDGAKAIGESQERHGDSWQTTGPASGSVGVDGSITVDRPNGPVTSNDLLWVRIAGSGGAESFTPLVQLASLEHPRKDALETSDRGWRYEDGRVASSGVSPPGPTVSATPSVLAFTFAGPPPTALGGTPVSSVKDVLHIRPSSDLSQPAPYDLVLDELNAELILIQPGNREPVTTTIRASLESPDSAPLPVVSGPFRDKVAAIDSRTRVEVQRVTLEKAIGAPIGPGSSVSFTREIDLSDGQRVVLSSVGQALAGPSTVVSPSTPGTTPASVLGKRPVARSSSGVSRRLLLVLVLATVVIGGLVFLVWGRRTMWWKEAKSKRRVRKRRAARDRAKAEQAAQQAESDSGAVK